MDIGQSVKNDSDTRTWVGNNDSRKQVKYGDFGNDNKVYVIQEVHTNMEKEIVQDLSKFKKSPVSLRCC